MSNFADVVGRIIMASTELPWSIQYIENDWVLKDGSFPWLVLDKWDVVIARFDFEHQAQACVDAVNQACNSWVDS